MKKQSLKNLNFVFFRTKFRTKEWNHENEDHTKLQKAQSFALHTQTLGVKECRDYLKALVLHHKNGHAIIVKRAIVYGRETSYLKTSTTQRIHQILRYSCLQKRVLK